jgi:hypothetical protein
MTVEELKREAGMAMASMKTQIEELHRCDPICLMHWPFNPASTSFGKKLKPAVTPGEWSRFPLPGQLLDSGDAKQMYFQMVRDIVADTGADGVIFGTDTFGAKMTAEGEKHGKDEWNRHVDQGFAKLVKMGWAVRMMAIHITAQSLADVVWMVQEYQRTGRATQWLHDAHTTVMAQEEFGGRQKMFGDLREENLGEPPAGSPAEKHQKGSA